jgi:hypothetical protein
LEARNGILVHKQAWKERKSVEIAYMSTIDMVADVLGGELFYRFANVLFGWLYLNERQVMSVNETDEVSAGIVGGIVRWKICSTTAT